MAAKCDRADWLWSGHCTTTHFEAAFPQAPGSGWWVGLLFTLIGLLTIVLSIPHYFSARNTIERNTYQPPDRWIVVFSLAVLLGAGVVYYVFTIPFELVGQVVMNRAVSFKRPLIEASRLY